MITREPFGRSPDGAQVDALTLSNSAGLSVTALTYGCILTKIITPDRNGVPGDVVLGHDDLDGYVHHKAYFGAVIGRHANRIREGKFVLDGREHHLSINEEPNHLHGGVTGFDAHVWQVEELTADGEEGIVFTRLSRDGEEGYPGTLHVRVRYTITEANELRISYEAEAEAATILNLTQHSYFNLTAGAAPTIVDHVVTLHADTFVPVDGEGIPTGQVTPVDGTPFDLRNPTRIGDRIGTRDEQLAHGRGGYDHNWVIRRAVGSLMPAARVEDPFSGRTLEVWTSEPGIQFYSGNRLDGSAVGKGGTRYVRHAALCLETQHFPDGPNHPSFPSPILRPGEQFRSSTVFRFSAA